MAQVILTNPTFYYDGILLDVHVVGWANQVNRVVRYTMYSPSTGASKVTLNFTGNSYGGGTAPQTLNFYIGTSDTSHINAGASSTRTGTLAMQSGTYNYSGSADIILLPNQTYYVFVFPTVSMENNYDWGFIAWGAENGNAVATTSGGAASIFTVANGTLGTSQQISVTQYSASFTHTITYSCGTASGTVASKASNTSITWTPPLDLASQNTSGSTVDVTFTMQTYSGSTAVGSAVTKVATMTIPASVKPSIDGIVVSDYMGYEDTYGAYVKGLSRLSINVTPRTSYGASIVSYKITANGCTYNEASCTTEALKSYGTLYVTATVTDTRGRTSDTASVPITVLNYTRPAITSLTANRCNSDGILSNSGAYVLVKLSASVTSLNYINKAEYVLNYKKSSATDWNGVALDDLYGDYSVDGYTYIFEADTTSSYNVEVTLEDDILGTTSVVNAPTAFALMHPHKSGTGFAIGKVAEKEDAFELGVQMYDKFGTLAGFGLAAYNGGKLDPNETLEELLLTIHEHNPSAHFYYIHTMFYNTKSASAARAQIAVPYNIVGAICHRYFYNGTWSSWMKLVNNGSNTGDVYIQSTGTVKFSGQSGSNFVAVLSDRMRADSNDVLYLGDASNKWKAVYAVNGTIQTSDRNQKTNIQEIGPQYVELFDKLQPVTFELAGKEHDRVHVGFISQDVKAAMDEVGLTAEDFAAYCRDAKTEIVETIDTETGEKLETEQIVVDENGDPVFTYSLRYAEFIALNSKMIQLNRQTIASQQQEIDTLKTEVEELKALVAALTTERTDGE